MRILVVVGALVAMLAFGVVQAGAGTSGAPGPVELVAAGAKPAGGSSAAPQWSGNTLTANCKTEPTTALQDAIAAAQSGDKIVVIGICRGNFEIIGKDLKLVGGSGGYVATPAVLDGQGNGHVLFVVDSTVVLKRLTIRNGNANVGGNPSDGGNFGGGILSLFSNLTVVASKVTGNFAFTAGGGITSALGGTLTVIKSIISKNSVVFAQGGGVDSQGIGAVATLTGSVVHHNSAAIGGGLSNFSPFSTLTVRASKVHRNSALGGGGIWQVGEFTTLTVRASKVHRNTSVFEGGGIFNAFFATALVRGSLIFKNTASDGGGVFDDGVGTVIALPRTFVFLNNPNNCVGVAAAGCLPF